MGTWNYLWHFILPVFLYTIMTLEGKDTATTTTEKHVDMSRSTNDRTGPALNSSNTSVTEPNTQNLLGTTSLSPSMMRTMGGGMDEGRMDTTPTTSTRQGSSLGMSPGSGAVMSAFPTGNDITTVPSMGTESGSTSSPHLSSGTTSHSSSSSSPEGSPAVTPSPQQSSTTGMPLATTSRPSTAVVLSSPSSTAGITSAQFSAGTAETKPQGPTAPRPPTSTARGHRHPDTPPHPSHRDSPQRRWRLLHLP
ncbi:PREDICTED: putative protein TPRXL [Pseudopodoces humilis]|uniref:putative protein TPRXL n=1 Tax=Pseudopodoces humilis TaxID=181119 RepID=UPI0006B7502B|nr:PREDICTED: putative protein TPRXL [Pseudopodoces humilis]